MNAGESAIIVNDPDSGYATDDIIRAWNAEAVRSDLPIAQRLKPTETFNAELLSVVGDVANVLGIASFIGVPTLATVVLRLTQSLGKKTAPQIEETVIDFGPNGKVQKITIRKGA